MGLVNLFGNLKNDILLLSFLMGTPMAAIKRGFRSV
jgi:hypothetical protein